MAKTKVKEQGSMKNAIKENNLGNIEITPQDSQEEKATKKEQATFEYDDETQEVFIELSDGKELIIRSPKTRQVLNAKKMSRRAFPEDEGEDLNEEEEGLNTTVALMSLCVQKYGHKDSMSVDEILDLELRDFTLVSKAFECFRDSIDIDG